MQYFYDRTHSISYYNAETGIWRNTWDDWHLIPSSRPSFKAPEPKYNLKTLVGVDGVIDFTEIPSGRVNYNNREGSHEFYVIPEFESDVPMPYIWKNDDEIGYAPVTVTFYYDQNADNGRYRGPYRPGDTAEFPDTNKLVVSEYGESFKVGYPYKVLWDGKMYTCIAHKYSDSVDIGSSSILNGKPGEYPFVIRAQRSNVSGFKDSLAVIAYTLDESRSAQRPETVTHSVRVMGTKTVVESRDWATRYTEIMEHLQGYRQRAILKDDRGFYYTGRFKVNEWKSDPNYSRITIDYNVHPYKYELFDSFDRWLWDPFNFQTGVIHTANILVESDYLGVINSRTFSPATISNFVIDPRSDSGRYYGTYRPGDTEEFPNTEKLLISEFGESFEVGAQYKVMWDGKSYTCTAHTNGSWVDIGSSSILNGVSGDYPFAIRAVPSTKTGFTDCLSFQLFTLDTSASHAVRVIGTRITGPKELSRDGAKTALVYEIPQNGSISIRVPVGRAYTVPDIAVFITAGSVTVTKDGDTEHAITFTTSGHVHSKENAEYFIPSFGENTYVFKGSSDSAYSNSSFAGHKALCYIYYRGGTF